MNGLSSQAGLCAGQMSWELRLDVSEEMAGGGEDTQEGGRERSGGGVPRPLWVAAEVRSSADY